MRSKLFILIIAGVLVLILAGAAYFFFTRSGEPAAESAPEDQLEETATDEQATSTPPELVIAEFVVSPVLSFDAERVWYFTPGGKLFRKPLTGFELPEEFVLPGPVENPVRVIWQETGSDFIVEQNLGGHTAYKFYSAEFHKLVDYPEQMRLPQFLPGDSEIVYDWVTAPDKHELKTSLKDSSNFRKVTDLFRPDYEIVASAKKAEAAVFGGSATTTKLMLVDLATSAFRNVDEDGQYFGAKFSPDGNKLLVSKEGGLAFYNLLATTTIAVNLNVTADISQAVWNKQSDEVIVASRDGVVKYSIETRRTEELAKFGQENSFAPKDVILHPTRPILFFVDAVSGYLYRVGLMQ